MKQLLLRILAVGAAGCVGAMARYLVGMLLSRPGFRFPIGTFVINITGSLFLGWFMTYAPSRNVSGTWTLAIGVGFVGAYTTFSTYMYDSVRLIGDKAWTEAVVNLFGSLILGLIAVRVGVGLARMM